MAYQLIAVDMDGTLLNSKDITPRTAAAVTQALARGYHVVMATGRSLPADRAVYAPVPGHALCHHVQRRGCG